MSKRIEIRCPIYGFIPLDEWEYDIIHHQAFQRLRRIRQLAWTDYVYPGAMHTRFEHTLGVMHMATLLFDQLKQSNRDQPVIVDHLGGNAAMVEVSRKTVRLAALLHDVGHSPFSHAGEELLPKRPDGGQWTHDEYSAEIIKQTFADVIDRHPRNAYGITAAGIADLIMGRPSAGKMLFWRSLVSGQIDADRMDYLLRDSHHCGVQYGLYGWRRLVHSITVAPGTNGRAPQIGVTEGGWNAAESLVVARYMMFNQVYFHKTRVIIDRHLQHALAELLPGAVFPPPTRSGIPKYLAWSDWRVLGDLARGRGGEHGARLRERRLYKLIRETIAYPVRRDLDLLDRWREALGSKLAAEIRSDKSWYKMGETDVPIVSEDDARRVRPLSLFSPIVRQMGQMQIVRLYVRDEDRAGCDALLMKAERGRKRR